MSKSESVLPAYFIDAATPEVWGGLFQRIRELKMNNASWQDAYRAYLSSPAWKAQRERSIHASGGVCTECGVDNQLQVHHLTYANVGNEKPEDLTPLCKLCHEKAHGLGEEDEPPPPIHIDSVRLDNPEEVDGNAKPLLCPRCDFNYLHQGHVVVKNRDEDRGGIITNVGGIVEFYEAGPEYFEGRRQTMWIKFSCEGCGGISWLLIMQHKGQTFMEWNERTPKGCTESPNPEAK